MCGSTNKRERLVVRVLLAGRTFIAVRNNHKFILDLQCNRKPNSPKTCRPPPLDISALEALALSAARALLAALAVQVCGVLRHPSP